MMWKRTPLRQRGDSLIEVMVAMVVLAIGLLGVAALQASSLRNNQSSFERSQAQILSYEILDAMRANHAAAQAGAYDMALTCVVPEAGATLAARDQARWIRDLHTGIGADACGSISRDGETYTITVRWNDARGTGGQGAYSVQTRSRL